MATLGWAALVLSSISFMYVLVTSAGPANTKREVFPKEDDMPATRRQRALEDEIALVKSER
jgi:hypothetical protein